MNNERVIATSASPTVNTYTLISDGNEVSRTYHMLSMTITNELNAIPSARIVFSDGEAAKETFPISDTPAFIPGAVIEIKSGYRGSEELIFKGLVVSHRIKVRKDKAFLIIECRDEGIKTNLVEKRKYFTEQTDSDIIETILGDYKLENEIKTTDLSHPAMVQYNSTDWQFILARAKANGHFCFWENGKLFTREPDMDQDPVVNVQYGASLLELDAEIDARHQVNGITTSSWSYANQELVTADAIEPDLGLNSNLEVSKVAKALFSEPSVLAHGGSLPEVELDSWANAALLWKRLSLIQGRARVQGNATILPGTLIQLNGVGERFSGVAFVSGVRHQIADGNWEMDIQLGYPQEWLKMGSDTATGTNGLLASVHGLHTGIVTQLEGDPDGEDRILIKMPVISTEEEGIWARISTLDAGDSRSSIFRPEIGDEVIVGFLNNDPRYPMILGMSHSSAKPSPIPPSDDNHEKGFVSRSDMRLLFNDDEISLSLSTPGGNKLVLSEDEEAITIEDQHGNKIVLDSDGIAFNSQKDIKMEASSDFKLEAQNTEIKASMAFKAEGSGGCKFTAGQGMTEVKGSLVKLN